MKKMIALLLVSSFLSAFTPAGPVSDGRDAVRELPGYRLRDTDIDLHDFNLWVITSEDAFNKTFIADEETASRPEFEKEMVLAAKVETLTAAYHVKFKKAVISGNSLNIYFKVRRAGPPEKGAGPVSLGVYPKHSSVRKVNFYQDDVLVRSVPMVNVY